MKTMTSPTITNDCLFAPPLTAKDGDLLAITAGVPLGVSVTTNLMKAEMTGGK